jgi:fibronectin-binding autotransporter adhesin
MTTILKNTYNGITLSTITYTDPVVISTGITIDGGTYTGMLASAGVWTLQNNGTILGGPAAIALAQGGTIINNAGGSIGDGTIGIELGAGYVSNAASANISGGLAIGAYSGALTVANAGTIASTDTGTGIGIGMQYGGLVTNLAGGVITGVSAIYAGAGSTVSVVNAGTIGGLVHGLNLYAGGTITNQLGGSISGGDSGINMFFGAGNTIINAGSILATNPRSGGIRVFEGPVYLTNQSSGTISGDYGIVLFNSAATIINAGEITGIGTYAYFNQSFKRGQAGVYAYPGGDITNQSGGTISGYSGILSKYGTLSVNNSGVIRGTGTIAYSAGIYDISAGTITNQTGGYITGANGILGYGNFNATVVNAGTIGGSIFGIALRSGGVVDNLSTGNITAYRGIYGGAPYQNPNYPSTTAAVGVVVSNAGTITATGAHATGINLAAGGAVTNQLSGIISANEAVATVDGYVKNAGSIMGTGDGNVGIGGSGTLVNAASGVISGYFAVDEYEGSSIVNAGTIGGPSSVVGIQLLGGGGITNQASGTIGGYHVIVGNTIAGFPYFDDDALTLVNAGLISGTDSGHNAIGVDLSDGGTILNQANATITDYAGIVSNTYGDLFLTNGGLIAGVGAKGVGIVLLTGGTIDNLTGGSISGSYEGIYNNFTPVIRTGFAGLPYNYGTFRPTEITNAGTIAAANTADAAAIILSHSGDVTNQSGGLITGYDGIRLHPIYYGDVLFNDGAFIGDAPTIENAGTILGTGQSYQGAALAFKGAATIDNQQSGLLSGYNAIRIEADGTSQSLIDNAGTILGTGTNYHSAAIFFGVAGAITNTAGGVIAGYAGIYGQTGSTIGIVNAGTILATGPVTTAYGRTASGASSAGIVLTAGGSVTNTADGKIIGGVDGIYTRSAPAFVENDGLITGVGTASVGIKLTGGGYILNHSVITAASAGIFAGPGLTSPGGDVTLVNTGIITSTDITVSGTYGKPSGVVFGLTAGTTGFLDNAAGGDISGYIGVNLYGARATLSNAGTVTGAKYAIYAAESFTLIDAPGAVFNGVVLDKAGDAALLLSGTAATAFTLGTGFSGFSTIGFTADASRALEVSASLAAGLAITGFSNNDALIIDGFEGTLQSFGTLSGLTLANGSSTEVLDITRLPPDAVFTVTDGGGNSTIAVQITPVSLISNLVLAQVAPGTGNYTSALSITGTGTIIATGTAALYAGSLASNVSVVNSGSIIGSSGAGVLLSNGALLDNTGLIQGATYGAIALAGASITNAGDITGATYAVSLNTATLLNTSTLAGVSATDGAMLTNKGSITGIGTAILLAQSSLDNTGLITGAALQNAVQATGGAVYNSGTITNTGDATGNAAVKLLGTAALTNTGAISDTGVAVALYQSQLINSGHIYAASLSYSNPGWGVLAGLGGSIDNSGSIGGAAYGVLFTNGGTLTNTGTISGKTDAVKSEVSGNLLPLYLTIDPHAVFNGNVVDASNAGEIILAGSTAGSIDLDAQFSGFTRVSLTAGADWTLNGTIHNAFGGAATLNAATLTNLGVVYGDRGGLIASAGARIINDGSISSGSYGVSFSQAVLLNNGSISGNDGVDANGGYVLNAGQISAYVDGLELSGNATGNNTGVIIGAVGVNASTLLNAGQIYFGKTYDYGKNQTGVSVFYDGLLSNTGSIGGKDIGVAVSAGGTVINAGTITGNTDAILEQRFTGGTLTLIVDPGAVFNGAVSDPDDTGILILGGTTAGALDLSNSFTGFSTISFATGATWSLTELAGQTSAAISGFTNGDTLVLDGFAATSTSFSAAAGLVLANATATQTLGLTGNFGPDAFAFTTLAGNTTITLERIISNVDPGSTSSSPTITNAQELVIHSGATVVTPLIEGGVLELNAGASTAGNIAFSGPGGTLVIEGAAIPSNTITGFAPGDTIELAGIPYQTGDSVSVAAPGVVSIDAGGTIYDLNIAGAFVGESNFTIAGDLVLSETGSAMCFCEGTNISTPNGEAPVEQLRIGDIVRTADGNAPIKWIGRRAYDGRFIAGRHLMLPVCIHRNAIAQNIPSRDLHVSPGHGIYIDDTLFPAWRLVNGVSITQAECVDTVSYFHIELARHAIIFAENCPAESFLDDADENLRHQFQNHAEYSRIYPSEKETVSALPRTETGFALLAVQRRLNARAGIAAPPEQIGLLRGYLERDGSDGIISGWAQDAGQPECPVRLDVIVDGHIHHLLANAYRHDLRAAGLGSGTHGFELILPKTFIPRAVELRRYADQQPLPRVETLQSSPIRPTLAPAPLRHKNRAAARAGGLRGYIEEAGTRLSGWAQDELHPESPVSLDVFINGTYLTNILADQYRNDLQSAGLGSGFHAFSLGLPPGLTGKITVRRALDGTELVHLNADRRYRLLS